MPFAIGMLATLLIWIIVIGAVVWLLYRFFKWSLTFLYRALTQGSRIREAQLQARERSLWEREQRLKAYLDREYQEWWERRWGCARQVKGGRAMTVWELVRDAMSRAHRRGLEWLPVDEIVREVHAIHPSANRGTIDHQIRFHCINDPSRKHSRGLQYRNNPLFLADDPLTHHKRYRLLTEGERQASLSNPRDDLDKFTGAQVVEQLGRPGKEAGPLLPRRRSEPAGTGRDHRNETEERSDAGSLGVTRGFSAFPFARVCSIQPECDPDGRPHEYVPQSGYRNPASLPLHRYGAGPFCSFGIPANLHVAGVYLLLVDDSVSYAGKCQNLSERFNSRGYGQIHQRNCYKRGQETNCRLNRLILEAVKQGHRIDLWFHETSNRHIVESKLIAHLAPPWNRTY